MALVPRGRERHDRGMAEQEPEGSGAPGQDLFTGIAVEALLATGRSINIRPGRVIDVAQMRAFYEALSDTAAYYRFLGLRPALVDDELQRSAQQSRDHVSLLAWLDDRLIGIGEFSAQGPNDAEIAMAIADDHHHEGVATLLLERLVDVARRCGMTRFVARTMRGNEEMRLVLQTLGLREHIEHDDGTVTYSLDLDSYDEMQRQRAARLEQALRAASETVRPQAPPIDTSG